MVVWRTVCLYGQARLFLVEQHLEEHIAVIQATAVEFVCLEDVEQVGVSIEVGVQLEETHLHQVVVELSFIDHLLNDIRILEDQ